MAIYKVNTEKGGYRTAQDVENVVSYILNPWKVKSGAAVSGAVPLSHTADAMECVTSAYHNEEGVHIRHTELSFSSDENISVDQAEEIAQECISYYLGSYQIIAAVHEDASHLHIHFGMNTTSYVDGSKYPGDKKDLYDFRQHINRVLRPYGIHLQK